MRIFFQVWKKKRENGSGLRKLPEDVKGKVPRHFVHTTTRYEDTPTKGHLSYPWITATVKIAVMIDRGRTRNPFLPGEELKRQIPWAHVGYFCAIDPSFPCLFPPSPPLVTGLPCTDLSLLWDPAGSIFDPTSG